ncbi:MAG: hypothetical protein BroJett018_50650 [Chloroflexota bacterium]|nr:MAG: hypothetical protein BroJett018_50650 [Chloroflexota bacterium]
MTVLEIMKQAEALSPQERKELVKLLVDSLEVVASRSNESGEHWGQSLIRLLEDLGPIETANPEIEDPVEWVQEQRRHDAERLRPYWDGEK